MEFDEFTRLWNECSEASISKPEEDDETDRKFNEDCLPVDRIKFFYVEIPVSALRGN